MRQAFTSLPGTALALALCIAAAAAQPPPAATATPESCMALLSRLPLSPAPGGQVTARPDGPDGCRFAGVALPPLGPVSYDVDWLLVRVSPFDTDPSTSPTRPTAIRIEAHSLLQAIRNGTPAIRWLLHEQSVPFDLVFAVRFDPPAGRLALGELSIDGQAIGRVALAGTLEHVPSLGPGPLPTDAALSQLHLRLDSRRFLTSYVLPALLSQLPANDPGAGLERAKDAAQAAVRTQLPAAGAPAESVDAILAFIRDFPHPVHVLDITLEGADQPVALTELQRAALEGPAAWPALLRHLHIAATYEGTPR